LFFRFSAGKKSAHFRANRKFRRRFFAGAATGDAAVFSIADTMSSAAIGIAQCRMKNNSRGADRIFAVFFCRWRIHRSNRGSSIVDIDIAATALGRKIRRKLFLQNG